MFNESQQRYLVSRLRSIDEMLSEAVERLAPSDSGQVFRAVDADATPAQRKVLADHLAQVRFALRRFMLARQLRDERRPTGGLWSLQTTLAFAQVAAEELRPKYWSGYGEVDPESAAAAERLAAELVTLLHRMQDSIARGAMGGLAERIERLSSTREEIALLKELERIISHHGLLELRAPLEALVERAASPRFEIAVFGRVSAGKSSLLNWWLGTALLPTGITPVTAVPTRIVHGNAARVRIERTGAAPVEVPVEDLAAYISEQGNPANVKRVLRVLIEAPALRLEGGIRLVDTPGLGSLATVGAAQTLEYLPQCDLGVLLIEAGAPVAPDDLDVARALLDGGSDLVIALSKADRLSSEELEQALAYVKGQFEARLSIPCTVRPVSTVSGHEALAEAWFAETFAPRLASHTERAAEALRRKIAVLRESVVAVLDARLGPPHAGSSAEASSSAKAPPVADSSMRLHDRIAQVRSDFERARSELLDFKIRLPRFNVRVVESAARELAGCWMEGDRTAERTRDRVAAAIAGCADEVGHAVMSRLDELWDSVMRIVEDSAPHFERGAMDAESARREAEREIARPRGRPVFDTAAVLRNPLRWASPQWLPRWSRVLLAIARARLRRTVLPALTTQLGVYGDALHHWAVDCLDQLGRRFDAAVAARESAERFSAERPLTAEAARAARRDLERLQQWPADAA